MSQLVLKYRSERSVNGFALDVLKSALQKYIRRGTSTMALYALRELLSFRNAYETEESRVKSCNTNMFHRMQIIALEDIGPTALPHIAILNLLVNHFRVASVGITTELLTFAAQFVGILCKLPKSRSCSWYKSYYTSTEARVKYEKVKLRESLVIRGHLSKYNYEEQVVKMAEHFFVVLCNKDEQCIYWAFQLDAKLVWSLLTMTCAPKVVRDFALVLQKWYADLKGVKESFLTWCIILIFWCENREVTSKTPEVDTEYLLSWLEENKSKVLTFDDYVYDMHTKVGRSHPERGSTEYFVMHSSTVFPEDPLANNKYRNFYASKKVGREVNIVPIMLENREVDEEKLVLHALTDKKSERDAFTLLSRCQLTCGNGKTDTYFAKVGESTVFVKGPSRTAEALKIMIARNEIKKKLGLPVGWMFMIELEVNMWEEVALGVRRSMKTGDKGWFLVCKDLIGVGDKLHVKTRNSTLWPDTQVVDFDKYELSEICESDFFNKEIAIQYVMLLLYRDMFGITDHANRNFIVDRKQQLVYSVDEDCAESDAKLNKIPVGRRKMINKVLEKYEEEILDRLYSWSEKVERCKVWFEDKTYEDIVNLFC